MTLCSVTNSKGRACVRVSGHVERHRYGRPLYVYDAADASATIVSAPSTLPYTTWASALCGDHIGLMISVSVRWLPSDVVGIVHGELRQLDHVGGSVTINIAGPESNGDLEEFTIEPSVHVYVS